MAEILDATTPEGQLEEGVKLLKDAAGVIETLLAGADDPDEGVLMWDFVYGCRQWIKKVDKSDK